MKCIWHLCNKDGILQDNKFCSKNCKNKYYVNRRRKNIKCLAVEHKGGKCEKCGYDKCIDALEFHHKDATKKDFGIAADGYTRSIKIVLEEADKCALLCSNCHREEHARLKNDGSEGKI